MVFDQISFEETNIYSILKGSYFQLKMAAKSGM